MRIYARGKKGILWVDTWANGTRINRSTSTTDRKAAQEWAAKITNDTWREKKLGETPSVNWDTAMFEWLKHYGDERKSIETMKARLRTLTPHLQRCKTLEQITGAMVEKILDDHVPGITKKTRNRYTTEVSKILYFAHSKGWITAVPKLTFHRERQNAFRWLTQEQVSTLMAELPAHLADMAKFALATGLRAANVIELRWNQIDMKRRVAWIEGADMKTGKPLHVPLNNDAVEVIERQVGNHATFVFVYEGHTVRECSTRAWWNAVERAGLSGFRWHDWRHTWASWHIQNGTPLPVLQKLGGWATLRMVEHYAHMGEQHIAQWADNSNRCKTVATDMPDIEISNEIQRVTSSPVGMASQPTRSNVLNLKGVVSQKRRKTA